MTIPDLCIYFVIAILSVAYPILLQVISRLDEKYSSIVIVDLFKKEREWLLFRIFTISTLVLVGLYALINLFLFLNRMPYINQAVVYLLFSSTVLLIIYFLLFISKILTYYTPAKIVGYFISKKDDQKFEYFNALSDILYFSIEQQKDVFARMIQDYYYEAFYNYRKKSIGKPVEYPQPYYQLVINTVSRLAPLNNRRFGFLEHRTVGGIWLIGEGKDIELSERTYSYLWNSLTIATNFERDDMVMQYWSTAHQHFIYHLSRVHPVSENSGDYAIVNQKAIDTRNNERNRFLEFNQALMGLLLFKNRLSCIKRIFAYTTSIPPSYDLLPVSMTEVFNIFFNFWDVYSRNFPFITFKYWYPETEGLNSEGLVKRWTSTYAALLFLRQYSIVEYYTYLKPLNKPQIPEKKLERKIWIENLDNFKRLVNEVYQNQELLKTVGLGFLNDDWCNTNHKPKPVEFIEDVKKNVEEAYKRTEKEQFVDEKELKRFEEATSLILEETLKPYLELFNNPATSEVKSYYIYSTKGRLPKKDFAEDKESDSLNYHSIYAQTLSDQVKEELFNTFLFQKRVNYRLFESDLFSAIDNLQLDPELYLIINFGIDLNFIDNGKIDGLIDNCYKGITIYNLPFYGKGSDSRLFIIKKSDLPFLTLKELPQQQIEKYNLELLNELNIYGSINDLFRNVDLKNEEIREGYTDVEEIEEQVLIFIGVNLEIKWKTSAEITSLSLTYPYFTSSEPANLLSDIKPIGF